MYVYIYRFVLFLDRLRPHIARKASVVLERVWRYAIIYASYVFICISGTPIYLFNMYVRYANIHVQFVCIYINVMPIYKDNMYVRYTNTNV